MIPTLAEVLELPALRAGAPLVRAGGDRLGRPVRWVHVSEIADIAGLLEGGELILTTGIALPRAQRDLRRYVGELVAVGVCGVAVELGRRYRALPNGLVEAALEADLPLIELRHETRFVAITQQVHTLILDARMREIVAADERQAHRTLLTLLDVAAELPPDIVERGAALGVPLAGHHLTPLVVACRGRAGGTDDPADVALDGGDGPAVPGGGAVVDEAQLREIAGRAADVLQALAVPALAGVLDRRRVAVVTCSLRPERIDAVTRRLADQLHAGADHRRDGGLVVAAGPSVTSVDRVRASLHEAKRVADTATGLPPHRGWFRASDLRLHGLAYALRESRPVLDFVARELGPVLAHDRDHGTALLDFLGAYCRAGGNKTAAAAELFVSRPALYDRIARAEQVLGVDLSDAQVVLTLHFALLARDALLRPGTAVRAV